MHLQFFDVFLQLSCKPTASELLLKEQMGFSLCCSVS